MSGCNITGSLSRRSQVVGRQKAAPAQSRGRSHPTPKPRSLLSPLLNQAQIHLDNSITYQNLAEVN